MENIRFALLLAVGGCAAVILFVFFFAETPLPPNLEVLKKYGFIEVEDTTVEHRSYSDTLFIKDAWVLEKTLIIDQAPAVVFEPGSSLGLGAGVSLLIKAPLFVQGNDSTPIVVHVISSGPFGVVAVIGNGSTRCDIEGLVLFNGSSDTIEGVVFSGALSLWNVNASIRNSIFEGCYGEDAVHVKDAQIEILHTRFEKNSKDQLDLDNVNGRIHGCEFRAFQYSLNADAIDLSRSEVSVSDCIIKWAGDKGLSAGEQSQVQIDNCIFEKNDIAVAAKDLSETRISNSTFENNRIVFAAYQKKKKYGGALIFEQDNQIGPSQQFDSTDATSKVVSGIDP